MKINLIPKTIIIGSLLAVINWLFFVPNDYPGLKVVFLDVGQGDAIFIQTPAEHKILIDGGPDKLTLEKLNQYLKPTDRYLDLVILTHPHADHLYGLIEILKNYQVNKIILNQIEYQNEGYKYFLKLIEKQKITKIQAKNGQKIVFAPNCSLKILTPLEMTQSKKINNSSIVTKLNCLEKNFLFTGDMEKELENILIANKIDVAAEYLKVGHHGSRTASSIEFLKAVKPTKAIISVGENNKFGHPETSTLESLQAINSQIWRTDLHGDIQFNF